MRLITAIALASALLSALVASPAPLGVGVARAECEPPTYCIVDVGNETSCAVNQTIDGQTCVRHISLDATYPRVLGQSFGVVLDHEDSNGNVSLLNTANTWTADRTTLTVSVGAFVVVVELYGYLSAQEPPYATTAQAQRLVTVQGTPVGAGLMIRNNEPVYCNVYTPSGTQRIDCRLTPVYELLPG